MSFASVSSGEPTVLSDRIIFVVGNSRSGTTMMGRILGNHKQIFTFNELHFFEELWLPEIPPPSLSRSKARDWLMKLFTIQEDGYYTQSNPERYRSEAAQILKSLPNNLTPPVIFQAYLSYKTNSVGKHIPCDQTPRNLYYLPEILELFPQSLVVNMIRDPRDVLLSQKKRWRRRFLGANTPFKQTLRVWSGYHPLTISLLWRSGLQAVSAYTEHPRVYHLHFEDLVTEPEKYIRKVCAFIGLDFQYEMLHVPQVGSSHHIDRKEHLNIDSTAAYRWRRGGLNQTEIFLCQKAAASQMRQYGYPIEKVKPNWFVVIGQAFLWVFKSGLAFLLNKKRVANIRESLRRRLRW